MRAMTIALRTILALTALPAAFADWNDVKARTPGDQIQVRSGQLWDWGKFVRATDDSLIMQMRTGEATIAKDEVDEVRVFLRGSARTKHAVRTGLIAAALVGGPIYPMLHAVNNSRPGLISGLFAAGPGVTGTIATYQKGSKRLYKRKR